MNEGGGPETHVRAHRLLLRLAGSRWGLFDPPAPTIVAYPEQKSPTDLKGLKGHGVRQRARTLRLAVGKMHPLRYGTYLLREVPNPPLHSLVPSGEGVAGVEVPAVVSGEEPLLALL
jgi:hypothetical protein